MSETPDKKKKTAGSAAGKPAGAKKTGSSAATGARSQSAAGRKANSTAKSGGVSQSKRPGKSGAVPAADPPSPASRASSSSGGAKRPVGRSPFYAASDADSGRKRPGASRSTGSSNRSGHRSSGGSSGRSPFQSVADDGERRGSASAGRSPFYSAADDDNRRSAAPTPRSPFYAASDDDNRRSTASAGRSPFSGGRAGRTSGRSGGRSQTRREKTGAVTRSTGRTADFFTDRQQADELTRAVSNRIVKWVVGIAVTLVAIFGLLGIIFVHDALQPVDKSAKTAIAVTVPLGSTTNSVGVMLQKKGIIKSASVFKFYAKFRNVPSFNAGVYVFAKSDTFDDIFDVLRSGASDKAAVGTVLVREGVTATQIADNVQALNKKNKHMTKKAFLAALKDKSLFNELAKQYPALLKSAKSAKDVRYNLEGYLFPATYSVSKDESVETLIQEMVAQTDKIMTPYYAAAKQQGYSVQEVLTLASLVEREAISSEDRARVAGVFENRLAVDMPLQSDISVMYALNTHKTALTNKDTSVDSPYNLYKNKGFGPGPFNNPSEDAIKAVLNPVDRERNYLYFVANMKTGEIAYANTLEQHNANIAAFAADNAQP